MASNGIGTLIFRDSMTSPPPTTPLRLIFAEHTECSQRFLTSNAALFIISPEPGIEKLDLRFSGTHCYGVMVVPHLRVRGYSATCTYLARPKPLAPSRSLMAHH